MKQDRNRERQHSKLKKTADKARAVKVQATGVAARRVQTEPTQVKAKGKIRGGQTEPVRSGSKRTEPVQKKQVKAERIQTELMQPERAPAKKAAERPQSGRSSAAQIKTASLPRCPYAKNVEAANCREFHIQSSLRRNNDDLRGFMLHTESRHALWEWSSLIITEIKCMRYSAGTSGGKLSPAPIRREHIALSVLIPARLRMNWRMLSFARYGGY